MLALSPRRRAETALSLRWGARFGRSPPLRAWEVSYRARARSASRRRDLSSVVWALCFDAPILSSEGCGIPAPRPVICGLKAWLPCAERSALASLSSRRAGLGCAKSFRPRDVASRRRDLSSVA